MTISPEVKIAWHEWGRGVALLVLVASVALIYLTDALSPQAFSLLVVSIAFMVLTAGFSSHCIHVSINRVLHWVCPIVGIVASAVACLTVFQQFYPKTALTRGELAKPGDTVGVVHSNTMSEFYVQVTGRPSVDPKGSDREVKATINVIIAQQQQPVDSIFVKLYKEPPKFPGKSRGAKLAKNQGEFFLIKLSKPSKSIKLLLKNLTPEYALPLSVQIQLPYVNPSVLLVILIASLAIALSIRLLCRTGSTTTLVAAVPASALVFYYLAHSGLLVVNPTLQILACLALASIVGTAAAIGSEKIIHFVREK